MSDPTVLYRVQDAIGENLAAIAKPDDAATALFGGDISAPEDWNTPAGPSARPTRIRFRGEPVPALDEPLAIVRIRNSRVDDLDQTTKRGHVMPWELDVEFSRDPDQEGAPDLRDIHTRILAQVKDRFGAEANRGLPLVGYGSTVVDNTFRGGGEELTPLDDDAEGDLGSRRFKFTLRYEAIYRHAPGDSRTAV